MKQIFKVGDKVYCPTYTSRVCILSETQNSSYPVEVGGVNSFTKEGMRLGNQLHPSIFHATEENHKLLTQLYGGEFEKPKVVLEGNELTKYLLQKDKVVLCDISNIKGIEHTKVKLIVKYCTIYEVFIDINGYYWNDATPLKYFPKDELTPLKMEIENENK